jgi:hypothetical protein
MHGIRTAIGIAAIALFSFAASASADTGGWTSPQLATAGNLTQPSMVTSTTGIDHIVARGDTGLWYETDKSGSWVRTRLTQDSDTHINGILFHKAAQSPLIAVNAAGTLTVVFRVRLWNNSGANCEATGLQYVVRSGGSWSAAQTIPDSTCETATGLVVHGGKIYLATLYTAGDGTKRISYFTDASGPWTRTTVAGGPSSAHISHASLTTYDGKPMLAYVKSGHLVYARGLTSTDHFTRETAAIVDSSAKSEPSVAINPKNDWPMIAWTQSDGTHYGYRNANGWYSKRVMRGTVRALLAFDSNGLASIASANGAGGLWFGQRISGSWVSVKLDGHTVTDLGGIGLVNRVIVSYARGISTSQIYWVSSSSGC